MALRDLVTGSDACTPDDGAGPSNAFAGLANSLLGTSSKHQERFHELPGLQGLPSSSEARYRPQRPEDVALAAAEAEQIGIPGRHRDPSRDVADFLHSQGGAGPSAAPWLAEFEQLQGGGPAVGQPRAQTGPSIVPFLHAFFHSAQTHTQFQPLPSPKIALSVADQCRIRDRSTIMARQIFADGGDAYADQQVGALLHSLHIDPRALPGAGTAREWDAIFHGGGARPDAMGAADAVAQGRAREAGQSAEVDRWANAFSDLNLTDPADPMVAEFLGREGGEAPGWAEEFARTNGHQDWAHEFEGAQRAGAAGGAARTDNAAAALQQTQALRDTLAASADPKMRNSKFMQFVSKMSRGEIILEDNQAKEVPGSAVGRQWAEQHADEQREAGFEDAWRQHSQAAGPAAAWSDQFHAEAHPPNEWADQFGSERVAEGWASDFAAPMSAAAAGDQEYSFRPDNPFMSDLDSFAKGKQLFRDGLLSEAVLALEAEVQRQPGNVDAWRLLGTVHAENDDDQQAIAALKKALQAAPGNAEALLSLGVSYTNELDQARALVFLLDWLRGQPGGAGRVPQNFPGDARERLRAVVGVFREAAERDAGSADLHVALGVLYNLARDYDGAVGAFRTALQSRTTDYSLWNKLGATLANSGRSGEAVGAYQRALDLKPNYMRAWTNLGISQANLGEYEKSAQFYVRALGLNPRASNVWGYLRTSVTCAGRTDLVQAVEDENLTALQTALPL